MFVLVSALLCAADSGVASTSVRQPHKLQDAFYLQEDGAPYRLIYLVSLWLFFVHSPTPTATQSTEWQPQAIAPFYTFQEENYLHKSFYILLYYLSIQIWLSVGAGGRYFLTIMKTLLGDARKISSLMTCLYFQNTIFSQRRF